MAQKRAIRGAFDRGPRTQSRISIQLTRKISIPRFRIKQRQWTEKSSLYCSIR